MLEFNFRDEQRIYLNCTDAIDGITAVAKDYVPYGKIALFVSENTDFGYLQLVKELKRQGNCVVCVAFPDGAEFSTDAICGTFNLHEDVRMVVAFGEQLSAFADYFATVRGVRSAVIASRFSDGLLQSRNFIKNGNSLDLIITDCFKTVITCGESDVAESFACIADKKTALMDYYARSLFLDDAFDGDGVDQTLKYLNSAEYALLNGGASDEFYRNLLSAVCVDRVAGGKFFGQSCSYVSEKILRKPLSYGKRLFFYADALNGAFVNAAAPPDYNALAERVSQCFGTDVGLSVNAFKRRVTAFKNADKSKILMFKERCDRASEYLSEAIKTYRTLGGKKMRTSTEEREAFGLCGDTFLGFNLMTALSEIPFLT